MAIKSIKLENFTVFENIECDFSPGVNIFIGENGTGKTHLLKALYAFSTGSKHPQSMNGEVCECNFIHHLLTCFGNSSHRELTRRVGSEYSNYARTLLHFVSDDGECNYAIDPSLSVQIYQVDTNKEDNSSVFIPSKDMLTHARGLLTMAKKHSNDMPFDRTLLDIVENAENWKVDETPKLAQNIAPILEKVIGGKIEQYNGDFFVVKQNGDKVRFALEAEGIKKFGLLWQLLMAEIITDNSILFWDEPEANLNPKLIPVVVDILLELSGNGVQVFLATHEYNLMKYFSVKKKDSDQVSFISLHNSENGVICEAEDDYNLLEHNAIVEANIKLLEDDIEGAF